MIPNLLGNIADWKKISKIARKYKLKIIEDSADTLGAKINGISTSIYYKTPVHQLPALSFMNKSFKLDKTVNASKSVLSLPLYPLLKKVRWKELLKKFLIFHNA